MVPTNHPSPGRRLSALGLWGGGAVPKPSSKQREGAVGKPQVPGLSLGVCSMGKMQWLELCLSLGTHLPRAAYSPKCKNGAFGYKSP